TVLWVCTICEQCI
ncbi:apurinic endonuclease family protein, partial [Vibrio parahaemolyticus VPCR-2009]